MFNFHTWLVIRNKPRDFFVAACLKLSAHTLARIYSEPRANHSRGSNGSNSVFRSIEENPDSHKYVNAKGTRIDRALYSICGNFAWLNNRKFVLCGIKQQLRHQHSNVTIRL